MCQLLGSCPFLIRPINHGLKILIVVCLLSLQSTVPPSATPPPSHKKTTQRSLTVSHDLQVPGTSSASSLSTHSATGGLSNSTPNLRDGDEESSDVARGEGGGAEERRKNLVAMNRYSVAQPSAIHAIDDYVNDPEDDVDVHLSASRENLAPHHNVPKVKVHHHSDQSSNSGSHEDQS